MTYVGYKIPRYSLGSTPWGTLAASNGSQSAVWVRRDPAGELPSRWGIKTKHLGSLAGSANSSTSGLQK